MSFVLLYIEHFLLNNVEFICVVTLVQFFVSLFEMLKLCLICYVFVLFVVLCIYFNSFFWLGGLCINIYIYIYIYIFISIISNILLEDVVSLAKHIVFSSVLVYIGPWPHCLLPSFITRSKAGPGGATPRGPHTNKQNRPSPRQNKQNSQGNILAICQQ